MCVSYVRTKDNKVLVLTFAPHSDIYDNSNTIAQTYSYVIDENHLDLSSQRLALVKATQITLKNALNLIGVEAPEKM